MRRLLILAAVLTAGCGSQIGKCFQYIADGTMGQHPECGVIPSPSPSVSPIPSPSLEPSAPPSPSTPPSPSATPEPLPSSSPSHSPACPRPDDVKIGFRAAVPKDIGFRNTFDLTPTYEGRALDVSCGAELVEKYGEFERFQASPVWGGGREAVELQSDNPYILVEATNSDEEHWDHGHFTQAGERTYCVSYHHLAHWRCQKGSMSDAGRLEGFGMNSRGFDLQK